MRKMTKADMPTSWGIFSPTGHVVMAFATDADANKASAALRSAGVAGDSILHYSPSEVLDLIKPTEDTDEKAFQMGQETEKVDRYAELAKRGSGFLVVYAPKDEDSKRVVDAARPFQLKFAEKYNRLTLEELA
jgi:tRNA A58 N-methylase Trm61